MRYIKNTALVYWRIITAILILSLLAGCNGPQTVSPAEAPTPTQTSTPIPIQNIKLVLDPDIIDVPVSSEIAIKVEIGIVQGMPKYQWTAVNGTLNAADKSSVIYTAPGVPGKDIVEVVVTIGSSTIIESKTFNVYKPTPTPVTATPTPATTPTFTSTPTLKPTPTRQLGQWPPIIADFDACEGATTLGGGAGAACPGIGCAGLSSLGVSYIEEIDRGCVARLEYSITEWSAYWMKITSADFTPFHHLVFDIRADSAVGVPKQMKIELKRLCAAGPCQENSIIYVSGITDEWQTMSVELRAFERVDYVEPLSAFTDMGELVFTFDAKKSGSAGIVFLDNIQVK